MSSHSEGGAPPADPTLVDVFERGSRLFGKDHAGRLWLLVQERDAKGKPMVGRFVATEVVVTFVRRATP